MRCNSDTCTNVVQSLGWCRKHYWRHRRLETDEYQARRAEAEQRFTQQHGTRSRYRKGCRCDDCRKAETEYRRRYRSARR